MTLLQLQGFRPTNLAYYSASNLHVLARDQAGDRLQIKGVSIGWDHVFVALAITQQQHEQLIYWCSDNILRLLTALRKESPCHSGDVGHVILQDRHTTLLLTRSHHVICLKELKDNWELSIIGKNMMTIKSCDVTIDDVDMKFALIDDHDQLMFLTGDHVIHHSSVLSNIIVHEVSCGANHMLLLETTGHVYSCGHGNRGQLGHGDTLSKHQPTIIELTVAMTIIKISAGGWHSTMLSGCHDIYTNGWNCDGQLGHNLNVAMVTQPTLITLEDDVEFSMVACGSRHTVAISNSNNVYTWGWNKYKQSEPWQQDQLIKDVKCGQWSTLYLTV